MHSCPECGRACYCDEGGLFCEHACEPDDDDFDDPYEEDDILGEVGL